MQLGQKRHHHFHQHLTVCHLPHLLGLSFALFWLVVGNGLPFHSVFGGSLWNTFIKSKVCCKKNNKQIIFSLIQLHQTYLPARSKPSTIFSLVARIFGIDGELSESYSWERAWRKSVWRTPFGKSLKGKSWNPGGALSPSSLSSRCWTTSSKREVNAAIMDPKVRFLFGRFWSLLPLMSKFLWICEITKGEREGGLKSSTSWYWQPNHLSSTHLDDELHMQIFVLVDIFPLSLWEYLP